jgi:hypothetical protein
MDRGRRRPASAALRWRTLTPLIVIVASFVAGAAAATWTSRRSLVSVPDTRAVQPHDKVQMDDSGYAKACEESNGVVVVRVPKPNGLECAWAEALLPLGPEVSR